VILLPGIRHVPRCGRNLALESQSVCDTDAMQTHEESTALKTLPLPSANWHGDCDPHTSDQGLLFDDRSFLVLDCRTTKAQPKESIVRRLICVIGLCLLSLPAFCQSTSKYQVATIMEVKPHQAAGDGAPDAASYDISVKVGDTIYVVLYITPSWEIPPKYAAGRNLLVLVGKSTITYNDMLGRSLQVPIQSQRPATEPKQSK